MCGTCGCGEQQQHSPSANPRQIQIEQDILAIDQEYAEQNRQGFAKQQILPINLVSSPGSGKTTLLEKTLTALKGQFDFAVIEGDQQTERDAQRIAATGTKALQINTGKGCHLDAHSINHAINDLNLKSHSILFIENVGNLVCPALFDLGEKYRVVILSVTEGDDKPLKYPEMFATAHLVLINKIDLLPYVDFNLDKCRGYLKRINPKLAHITLSTTSGENCDYWFQWLKTATQSLSQPAIEPSNAN